MDFEQPGEIYVPTLWDRIQPMVTGATSLVMTAGLIIAGLAAAYLVYGILGGGLSGYSSMPHDDRVRLLSNISVAAKAMKFGIAFGSIAAVFMFFGDEALGYGLFLGAAAVGIGIPYFCRLLPSGTGDNHAIDLTFLNFISSAYIPAILGALLIARDFALRLGTAVKGKTLDQSTFTFGGEAKVEARPARMSILAKCWEGPYCREFIRPHCPIFIARKACWREKRGCYCEEDIVSAAASKINGIVLDMAPDPKYNFANVARPVGTMGTGDTNPYRKPELSHAQKVQRCKYCVIYNEHEREKYKLLVPVVMVGTIVLCVIFAPLMRTAVGEILGFTQGIVDRFSFGSSPDATVDKLSHPTDTIEWIFVAAFTIMIASKFLQVLEWMCFTAKI